jgi:hypothetical protein
MLRKMTGFGDLYKNAIEIAGINNDTLKAINKPALESPQERVAREGTNNERSLARKRAVRDVIVFWATELARESATQDKIIATGMYEFLHVHMSLR